MALTDGYFSLSADVNKVKSAGDKQKEGPVTEILLPELELSMSNEELIQLKKKWLTLWAPHAKLLKDFQDRNKKYWLGQQETGQAGNSGGYTGEKPVMDNLIFESLEEFLPQATKQNPEPVVTADNTPQGIAIADKVSNMLSYQADQLQVKLKLKQVVRLWAINRIGVAKLGWSMVKNDLALTVLRPQKLILDPDSTIMDSEYTGEFLGEYKEEKASNLIKRFPKHKSFIENEVKDQTGTKVQYIEWWTNEYLFWTLKDEVLGKVKNPHWNYDEQVPQTDDQGQISMQTKPGQNHFDAPKKPYVFFSVFNLYEHPYDDTSLIEQVIPLQDLINKRLKQIDKNADNTNGGVLVSGDAFSKEQAAKVVQARRDGGAIWIPSGNVNEAVASFTGPPLAPFVYQSLVDYRGELRGIFGVQGLTSAGQSSDRTVRGKIITRQHAMDRIGGGVSEFLEQFADAIFNWMVQLMYVYYTETHAASIIGDQKAVEYIQIKNSDLNRKLNITVKEGSMLPKDTVSKRNEALELWSAGAIDPISLYERLDFPNPREMAEMLFTWQQNPAALFQPGQQSAPPPQPGQPVTAIPQQGAQGPTQPTPSILSRVPLSQAGATPAQPNM